MVKKLKKLSGEYREFLKEASFLARQQDFRIYLVGGVVRDLLLNKEVFDLDIVVEGDAIAFVHLLSQKLSIKSKKHHSFGTAAVYFNKHKIDFATARKEYYTSWAVLPKVKPAGLEEDLFRRDFTINAMAISLNEDDYGKLIDYYSGLQDLKKGLLRVLHDNSFLDDPTRILRAVRFEQRFSFCMEDRTGKLLNDALKLKVINLVHPHRLRDELILLLQESRPYCNIKRISKLTGFFFISRQLSLDRSDYNILLRIEESIGFYKERFGKYRKLQEWIIYLIAVVLKLSQTKIACFLNTYDFRKGEKIRVLSAKSKIVSVKKLDRDVQPHVIYQLLNSLSFECIIFFHAYYREKKIKSNIGYFLDKLVNASLEVRGEDLKKLGLQPYNLYSAVLDKLLYAKIDKGLVTKEEEIEEAKKIFNCCLKKG